MQKHQWNRRIWIGLLSSIILCILMIVPVMAEIASDAVIDLNRTGSINIDYKEDVGGQSPINGAEFTAYRIANIEFFGNYTSIIPAISTFDGETEAESIVEQVLDAYNKGSFSGESYKTSVTTAGDGKASMQNLPLGLYLVMETSPAKGYFVSKPFFASLPYTKEGNAWIYDPIVEPKPLSGGELVLKKIVSGDGGDTNREFHFKVVFEEYNEPITCTLSTGRTSEFKSGDTVALKHDQSATFSLIPAGTKYSITETEANADGYVTVTKDETGNIEHGEPRVVTFYNTRRNAVDTSDTNLVLICGAIVLVAGILTMILLNELRKTNKELKNAGRK